MTKAVRGNLGCVFALLAVGVAPGCTCGAPRPGRGSTLDASSASPVSIALDGSALVESATRLSAPIGASLVPGSHGAVLVAGLVVPKSAIVLTRLGGAGGAAWSNEILKDVAWTSDAELRVFASAAGDAFVVWRGKVAGKGGRVFVHVGSDGVVRGEPQEVGGAFCGTDKGLVAATRGGRLVEHAWTGGAARDLAAVPADADPLLLCGATRAFLLAQREESLDLEAPRRKLDDADEDHFEYTRDDVLGLVRLGGKGSLSFREVHGDAPSPWAKLPHAVGEDDEVVAVDGDERGPVVILTHEDAGGCGAGRTRTAIHVVRREARSELAKLDCGVDPGPFFTGALDGDLVVAWPERPPNRRAAASSSAPIASLGFVRIPPGAAPPLPPGRIAVEADALVDAGCHDGACYAVALVRPAQTDGMVPGPARLLRYP